MDYQDLQYKFDYFQPISELEQQCKVCQKNVCIIQTEGTIEQILNKHFLSKDHLQRQYQILLTIGFFEEQKLIFKLNNNQDFTQTKLFNMKTAKDLKSQGQECNLYQQQELNKYFENCIIRIDCVTKKELTTQKAYLYIFRRFYNYIFDIQINYLHDDSILNFLQSERFKRDSISALTLLAKALGQPFSILLHEQISLKRNIQLDQNLEKSKAILFHSNQLIVFLYSNSKQQFALIIFLLFELDIEINLIPNLKYEDLINNQQLFSKQKHYPINSQIQQAVREFIKQFNQEKSANIMPNIRSVRDLQSLLQQVKNDYSFESDKSNQEFYSFLQRFHLSQIKFAKRYLCRLPNKKQQNKLIDEIYFPDLLQLFLSLLQSEKNQKVNDEIINRQKIPQLKRSQLQLQQQRELNKIQMIEASNAIIQLEDSQDEVSVDIPNQISSLKKNTYKQGINQDNNNQQINEEPGN